MMDNQTSTTQTTQETTTTSIAPVIVDSSNAPPPPVVAPITTSVITTQVSNKILDANHDPEIRKRNSLAYYLTLGLRGLMSSKKGSFCLLILAIVSTALFMGKISGMEFVSAATVISGIYSASSTATDITGIRSNQ